MTDQWIEEPTRPQMSFKYLQKETNTNNIVIKLYLLKPYERVKKSDSTRLWLWLQESKKVTRLESDSGSKSQKKWLDSTLTLTFGVGVRVRVNESLFFDSNCMRMATQLTIICKLGGHIWLTGWPYIQKYGCQLGGHSWLTGWPYGHPVNLATKRCKLGGHMAICLTRPEISSEKILLSNSRKQVNLCI